MRPLAMISIAVVLSLALAAQAQVPETLSYQGVLRDDVGTVVPDGIYDLTFRIYDTLTGGTALWYETQAVTVTDGMVNVVLGRVMPVSLAFDRQHWLGVSVEGEAELVPRVELASVPYAHRAAISDAVQGGAGDTDWVESGGNVYRLTGNVGIGIDIPWKRLHIKEELAGGISYAIKLENSSGADGTATGILFKVDSSNEDRGKGAIVYERTATWNRGDMHFLQDDHTNSSRPTLEDIAMTIANDRKVGIGTASPVEPLHVAGIVYSSAGGFKFPDGTVQTTASGGSGGGLVLPYAGTASINGAAFTATNTDANGKGVAGNHSTTGNYGWLGTSTAGVIGYHGPTYTSGLLGAPGRGVEGDGGNDGTGVYGGAYNAYGVHGYASGESTAGVFGEVTKTSSSAVLGTNTGASTAGKLGTDLAGVYGNGAVYGVQGVSSTGGYAVYGANSQGTAVYGVTTTGTAVSGAAGAGIAVSGSCSAGGYAGDFRGNVRVRSIGTGDTIIEFGEGLDYAEGFDVAGPERAEPGDVLIIDAMHAGELSLSHREYDTRVAGIVAGANGLGSAVRLGGDRFDLDVALAGRVYCNVDASEAGVEPGDLLTTSAIPGFAMKVTDPTRAQGAILGKAMERLEQGERGQILVLVTLQ